MHAHSVQASRQGSAHSRFSEALSASGHARFAEDEHEGGGGHRDGQEEDEDEEAHQHRTGTDIASIFPPTRALFIPTPPTVGHFSLPLLYPYPPNCRPLPLHP